MFNNYSTPRAKNYRFDLYNQLSNSFKIKKREKHSLHELIIKEQKEVYNMLSKDPDFKGDISKLVPIKKSEDFYEKVFLKGFQKGNYLLDIIKNIQKKKDTQKAPLTQRLVNRNNKIEILKRKKMKWENRLKLLQKPLIKKNNSFLHSSKKLNESLDKLEEKKSYVDYSRNLKPIKNLKKNYNFNTGKSQRKKLSNLHSLLFKCEVGINEGQSIRNNFEQFHKLMHQNDKKISSDEKNNQLNSIFKMLEAVKKKKKIDEFSSFDKYKTLEEKKMKEFKKDLIFKVSDILAYSNRNEYNKKIKSQISFNAYDLYLDDVDTINKKISSKRKIEEKNIEQLNILLDDFHMGKELLKKKLDELNEKNEKYKNIKGDIKIDFNEEEDISKYNEKVILNNHKLKNPNDITFYSRFKHIF